MESLSETHHHGEYARDRTPVTELNWQRIKVLHDNYIWLVADMSSGEAVVIDPAQSHEVNTILEQRDLKLTAIFNTHHHGDHVGGNRDLVRRYSCSVYGSLKDRRRIPCITHPLRGGDKVRWGRYGFEVAEVDGHTLGHISYFEPRLKWLFIGDTLFSLGCGRLFEGTARDMQKSMDYILSLPPETLIFCAHEYTIANALWCRSLMRMAREGLRSGDELSRDGEAVNKEVSKEAGLIEGALERFYQKALQLCQGGQATIPSTLAVERELNPFLRTREPTTKELLGLPMSTAPHKVLAELRAHKDDFVVPLQMN